MTKLTTFVTGILETMGRNISPEKVRTLGGTFQSSVGKDTTCLVVCSKVGTSELKKPQSYATKLIDEQQFWRCCNAHIQLQ